jgi:hypothetical protein
MVSITIYRPYVSNEIEVFGRPSEAQRKKTSKAQAATGTPLLLQCDNHVE